MCGHGQLVVEFSDAGFKFAETFLYCLHCSAADWRKIVDELLNTLLKALREKS